MKKTTTFLSVALAAFTLAGCSYGTSPNMNAQSAQSTQSPHHAKALHDPSVIPSETGPKVHTTNKHGKTTNGMGTSVYSMIGSSGLHSNGFSAHLESRLSGLGISDVRVFVFDDTVVLAAAKRETSASQYDELQMKLLNSNEGMSSNGVTLDGGVKGKDTGKHDNLSMAASQIKSLMGAEVKVLTVTGDRAVKAIEKIRTDALAKDLSPSVIASDIRVLLELVEKEPK